MSCLRLIAEEITSAEYHPRGIKRIQTLRNPLQLRMIHAGNKKYKQVIYERNYLMIEITMLGREKVDKVHKKITIKNRIRAASKLE